MIEVAPNKSSWKWIIILIIAGTVIGGAYYFFSVNKGSIPGIQNQPQVQSGNTVSVEITSAGFSPANIIIKKGATVVWTNKDNSPHTVTATQKNGPHSPELQKNSSYSDTFTTTGTYPYHCTIHPNMTGSIQVVE